MTLFWSLSLELMFLLCRSELPGERLLGIPEKIRISGAAADRNGMQFGTTQDLGAFSLTNVSYLELCFFALWVDRETLEQASQRHYMIDTSTFQTVSCRPWDSHLFPEANSQVL